MIKNILAILLLLVACNKPNSQLVTTTQPISESLTPTSLVYPSEVKTYSTVNTVYEKLETYFGTLGVIIEVYPKDISSGFTYSDVQLITYDRKWAVCKNSNRELNSTDVVFMLYTIIVKPTNKNEVSLSVKSVYEPNEAGTFKCVSSGIFESAIVLAVFGSSEVNSASPGRSAIMPRASRPEIVPEF